MNMSTPVLISESNYPVVTIMASPKNIQSNKPCPWSTPAVSSPPVQSFSELMSEELAKDLQEKENKAFLQATSPKKTDIPLTNTQGQASRDRLSSSSEDELETSSDEVLARMLQEEFNREHDLQLKKCEQKVNANSKVCLSFLNYRLTHEGLYGADDYEDEFDDYDDDDDELDQDKGRTLSKKKGIAGKGKDITTKHDAEICGKKNASRVMEFPPGFETGDGKGMQLPNHVYNALKVHSHSETKRGARVRDKQEKATAELSVDPRTRLLLYKLVNSGLLDAVNGCISTGKEATVFHATGGRMEGMTVPSECALKVFKTTLNEFKNREQYINDDYRFSSNVSKQNPRSFIKAWAEKEMKNLNRMRRAAVPCPEVVQLKKHILVMTFVGQDHVPAPKLKDAVLSQEQWKDAYQQCVKSMKTMYTDAHLVHADLSEYNMLWHNSQVWMIDVSQSVEPTHQHAMEFLLRDCTNVSQFFKKSSVPDVMSPSQLFNEVTGLGLGGEGQDLLAQVQEFEKNVELVTHGMTATGKDYNFDYFFEKSNTERKEGKREQPPQE